MIPSIIPKQQVFSENPSLEEYLPVVIFTPNIKVLLLLVREVDCQC